MKLISYLQAGKAHWGCVVNGGIVDLGKRLPEFATVLALLESGESFYGTRDVYWLSHIINAEAGNQPIPADLTQLKYGCSVTDACVDWATTEKMIREADAALRGKLNQTKSA